jgi:tetratricopeptide (TPR) repeat protein
VEAIEPHRRSENAGRRALAQLKAATALAGLGRDAEADATLEAAAGADAGETSRRAWLELANRWSERRPDAAERALRAAIRDGDGSPVAAQATLQLGMRLRDTGPREQAETMFAFAGAHGNATTAGIAGYSLGNLRMQRGDVDGAVEAFSAAIGSGHGRSRDISLRSLVRLHGQGAFFSDDAVLLGPAVATLFAAERGVARDDHERLARLWLTAAGDVDADQQPMLLAELLGDASDHLQLIVPLIADVAELAFTTARNAYALDVNNLGAHDDMIAAASRRLAAACATRAHGDRQDDVELGLRHAQAALAIETGRGHDGITVAILHNTLGALHVDDRRASPGEGAERAIGHFEAAISIYERLLGPDSAHALSATGNLLDAFAGRSWPEAPATRERAIRRGEQAIERAQWRDRDRTRLLMSLITHLAVLYNESLRRPDRRPHTTDRARRAGAASQRPPVRRRLARRRRRAAQPRRRLPPHRRERPAPRVRDPDAAPGARDRRAPQRPAR